LVLFAERIALQSISVRMELAERFPTLRLDAVQIKQAILNLVANALEAMPAGGRLTLATQVMGSEEDQSAGAAVSRSTASRPAAAEAETSVPTVDQATAHPAGTEWVTLSVGDTGGGIPQEIVDEVFNPFFTTKEIGTGLGLTLVRRIARAHQGRVEVQNHPGKGVTFCLWLPVSGP
jgi:signal transduction histidine kinase